MFNKIANLYIDVYNEPSGEYLGSNVFRMTPEMEKVFLDMINYHIIPNAIVMTDVNFYQASSSYTPPEMNHEQPRRGVVHAKVRDANSKVWTNVEIYFTFNSRTRGNYLGEQYHFDSVTYSGLQVQEIRLF